MLLAYMDGNCVQHSDLQPGNSKEMNTMTPRGAALTGSSLPGDMPMRLLMTLFPSIPDHKQSECCENCL